MQYHVWFHYSWKLQAKGDRIALYKDRELYNNLDIQHFRLLYGGEKLYGKSKTMFRTLVMMISRVARYLGVIQLFFDAWLGVFEANRRFFNEEGSESIWL